MRDDVRVGNNVLVQGGLSVGPAGALIGGDAAVIEGAGELVTKITFIASHGWTRI